MHVKPSIDSLIERLRLVLRYTGLSQRQFAARVGVSSPYISDILRNGMKPSVDILIAIPIEWPNISARWLLTGLGNMIDIQDVAAEMGSGVAGEMTPTYVAGGSLSERDVLMSQIAAAQHQAAQARELSAELEKKLADVKGQDSPVPDYRVALEQELVKLWGVGDVALVARRGSQSTARTVLQALLAHYPGYVDMATLTKAVVKDDFKPIELASEVAVLLQQGLIERVNDEYRVVSEDVELRLDGVAELSQLAVHAVTELMTSILPKAISTKRHGKLVLADLYVAPGSASAVADSLLTALKTHVDSVVVCPQGEHITLVIGVGVDDST